MKKEIEHELPYYCPTLDGSGFSKKAPERIANK